MNRRMLLLALAVLATMLLMVACGPDNGGAETPGPTDQPVTTQIPVTDLPTAVDPAIRFDPAVATDSDTLLLCDLIYDGLTQLDQDGNPQPALALSWTVSDDQLDYVVTLRQDAAFQDGTPFDADVVLDNFNRWFDPLNALHVPDSFSGWETEFLGFKGDLDDDQQPLSTFDGIEKVDNYTVLIHLNRPVPDLMVKLAKSNFLMLDPALLASAGEAYGTSSENTSGTGAYLISAWTDTGLEFAPNASYWGTVPEDTLTFGWK